MVFYDAFLVDAPPTSVTTRCRRRVTPGLYRLVRAVHRMLGRGVGWAVYRHPHGYRHEDSVSHHAAWWVAFSIPLIRDVHQTHYKERAEHLIRDTFGGLWKTVKRIFKDRRLRLFMLAFFCYIDGVHTIIKMSTSYGTDLGIDATQLVLALLVTQFVAFPSAIATGVCPQDSARSACCW